MATWSRLGPPTRRPRTVFDWMIGVSLVAIGLAVAVPRVSDASRKRAAVDILDAVREVEEAARTAARAGDWPALEDAPAGRVPAGLSVYLPEGFAFDDRRFVLDWDLFEIEGMLRPLIVGEVHGGISVTLDTPELADEVQHLAGRRVWMRVGDEVSFLVPGLGDDGA
ncbi:MAG: hypothetical protein RQ745_08115 [Longimicrobiales bacterium]|nr:hypothetical protein [Longimicrobiales bacterium]